MSYDIFISYRRKGSGAGVAGEMQSKLQNRGYKVFLDVDNIGSGAFPDQIDSAIKQCNDFLLILSPGMLDRCSDPEDWVRHEIVLAEKYGKNIVGVSLPGFMMPTAEELPEELHEIPEKQVFLWSHEYRHASFEKIVDNLLSTTLKKKRVKRIYMLVAAAVVALAAGLLFLLMPSGADNPEGISDDTTIVNTNMPTNGPFVPVEEEPAIDPLQLLTERLNDTFATYVRTGDSLLKLIPKKLIEKQDFSKFMACYNTYKDAVAFEKDHHGFISNTSVVTKRCDSLTRVRKRLFNDELGAASEFLGYGFVESALPRYENASIVVNPDDKNETNRLENVGKKMPKSKK